MQNGKDCEYCHEFHPRTKKPSNRNYYRKMKRLLNQVTDGQQQLTQQEMLGDEVQQPGDGAKSYPQQQPTDKHSPTPAMNTGSKVNVTPCNPANKGMLCGIADEFTEDERVQLQETVDQKMPLSVTQIQGCSSQCFTQPSEVSTYKAKQHPWRMLKQTGHVATPQ